ncbi:MAG: hypothetical protein LBL80_02545 [Ruminococcus sp.]|jgi:hypothetical protein|nr:hypothetical protein [Ruminococcus sp.]
MADLSEKTIESLSWRKDMKKSLTEYYDNLIDLFPEYRNDFVFNAENMDRVFEFYKSNCYSQLKDLLPKKQEGTLDRHKIISAYIISFLVKENAVFSFNWDNHKGEAVPFPLVAAIEIFLVEFARSYLREFIIKEMPETGFTGRSNINGYDIILPDRETTYEINGDKHISDFYDNYVKLMIMIKQGLEKFEGKDIERYPLIPTILLLSNDLYLLEAVSDCGKYNRSDLYYSQKANPKQ